jgi:DNA-binding transcriptional regulator YhcF (GntR family)
MQIVSRIRADILGGVYQPDQQIPAVRQLAQTAGVNPNTMQRALSELERSGLVNSQRTAGRFITDDAAALAQLRVSMSEGIADEFCRKLRSLGMRDDEILSLVQGWIATNSKEET